MISHFQNRHLGQTALIIGNGPSLVDVPRPFIDAHITFGQNKCYLNKPPLVDFTPAYYVTSDPDNDIDYNKIRKMNCVKFLKEGLAVNIPDCHTFKLTREHIFSKHPEMALYEGYSVTFISLQLAYYLGFSTVLLIGCDHRYIPYDASKEKDPNHYTSDYKGKTDFDSKSLAKGQKFINESMILADVAYKNDGRRIVNLTPNSRLTMFEMDEVKNWM